MVRGSAANVNSYLNITRQNTWDWDLNSKNDQMKTTYFLFLSKILMLISKANYTVDCIIISAIRHWLMGLKQREDCIKLCCFRKELHPGWAKMVEDQTASVEKELRCGLDTAN